MSPSADRNLLFGILALQMVFVTREQLIAGMNASLLEKSLPLERFSSGSSRCWQTSGTTWNGWLTCMSRSIRVTPPKASRQSVLSSRRSRTH